MPAIPPQRFGAAQYASLSASTRALEGCGKRLAELVAARGALEPHDRDLAAALQAAHERAPAEVRAAHYDRLVTLSREGAATAAPEVLRLIHRFLANNLPERLAWGWLMLQVAEAQGGARPCRRSGPTCWA